MSSSESPPKGPDLSQGIAVDACADGGMLAGRVGDEAVLLARRGREFFALGANCTHYGGPLAEGLLAGETVRCPWHHACFSLRTGEALHAPALSAVACWLTEVRDGRVWVRTKVERAPTPRVTPGRDAPARIVIVGGGAAGFAAAEMLRRQQYQGSIVMVSDDDAPPVDRPNLSKDYLAGSAPEDWLPLRSESFYAEQRIDLRLKTGVASVDLRNREVALVDGKRLAYDRLLLATGAEPIRLPIPGMDLPHVLTLRGLADCRAIIARAATAKRVLVMGASFIGLEVAASLRARGIETHVVAPEKRPLERVMGPQIGDFVRDLHEEHGVIFHLEDTATAIEARRIALKSGASIDADLVVAGVGVRPRLKLAEQAGLAMDRGVSVNEYLQTSTPDVFAAGDIARWPDAHSGEAIRVEHWVVAQRQGQVAALNMLGGRQKFEAVPFFWSQHYDVPINYVGHAEAWDEVAVDGDAMARDCAVRFKRKGRVLAVASIYRDIESLAAEVAMEGATA
jgi:NADPH-dependent 2,4-dienoyl-CoA reductase/sulfur reductase-like enzyme/nitrite reductase/ring-hydroxylating ferredoxin subunit